MSPSQLAADELCHSPSPALTHLWPSCCNAGSVQNQQLLTDVSVALTELWSQHARSPRLATPILRTTEVLLSQTQILTLHDDTHQLLGEII